MKQALKTGDQHIADSKNILDYSSLLYLNGKATGCGKIFCFPTSLEQWEMLLELNINNMKALSKPMLRIHDTGIVYTCSWVILQQYRMILEDAV